ncbi:MAG: hypothetical protein BRD50_07815 [Bacteroidetes bacterium SW_11_45_7]|nr:MAG: hypothetical protein BRD50_07815 [Bacteroidetes bacterium SW_11_45_7]
MSNIYQLKIELAGSEPLIWRRIQVPHFISFKDLHQILQEVMSWFGEHCYKFEIDDWHIHDDGPFQHVDKNPKDRESHAVSVHEFLASENQQLTYIYDFGDHWEHLITVEKIVTPDNSKLYPQVIDGAGACPPEDCGGVFGYSDLLEALNDQEHPDHENALDVLGEEWDASFFNRSLTNYSLMELGEKIRMREGMSELSEYEELKDLRQPEDIYAHEKFRSGLFGSVEERGRKPSEKEAETFERLANEGFTGEKAKELIQQAMAIEIFYLEKHEISICEERYLHNLTQLPQPPEEFPTTQSAVYILEQCEKGIPYQAIEYLQKDRSAEARNAIISNLAYCTKHEYYMLQSDLAPLWFAVAAEGHLCEDLIEPVIGLVTSSFFDWDFLFEQVEWLITALAEKFPDIVVPRVIEVAKDPAVQQSDNTKIIYLYDALAYADTAKYEEQIIEVLKDPNTIARDMWGHQVSYLQLKSALPVLKDIIEQREQEYQQKKHQARRFEFQDLVELEEAREELQTGVIKYPDVMKPAHLSRENWREHYASFEDRFYDLYDDWYDDYPANDELLGQKDSAQDWSPLSHTTPIVKEEKPGRNDPCHCGSGKKYKKCCLRKDEDEERMAKR